MFINCHYNKIDNNFNKENIWLKYTCINIYIQIRTVTNALGIDTVIKKNALNIPCRESILHNGQWKKFKE